jgi:GNAT superfamily N-acetyltransferase
MPREDAMTVRTTVTDADLARRLERFEARCAIEMTAVIARRLPDLGAEAWHGDPLLPGTVAVWCGPDSPLSRVIALGVDGPAHHAGIVALEARYAERATAIRLELRPLAGADLARKLGLRGYRLTGFEDMLARDLAPADAPALAAAAAAAVGPGVVVREAAPEEAQTWGRLAVEGFFGGASPAGFEEQMAATFELDDTAIYVATVDGEPAACGAVTWRDGVAGLYAMATLERFRRRGIQGAMVATRLARAARAGCDLASVGATPGGDSHRNLERFGFRARYTRVNLTFRPVAPDDAESRTPA